MTIFVDAQTLEDLSTYDGLLRSVASWLNRDDLTDRIPYFIKLAEAQFRRVIRNIERETEVEFDPASSIAFPNDFDSIRSLAVLGLGSIQQVSANEFYAQRRYPGDTPVFAIIGNAIRLSTLPSGSYTALLSYVAGIPDLTPANPVNWLLTQHPDIYLFGALLHAEFYGWNDDRLGIIKGRVDEMLAELAMAGLRKRHGGGPLVMRNRAAPKVRGAYRGGHTGGYGGGGGSGDYLLDDSNYLVDG